MADSYYETAQPHPAASDGSYKDEPRTISPHNHISLGAYAHPNGGGNTSNGYDRDVKPNVTGDVKPVVGNSGAGGTGGMIKKSLGSWVGFSNLPNQVHRRSVK
jgi:septin 7